MDLTVGGRRVVSRVVRQCLCRASETEREFEHDIVAVRFAQAAAVHSFGMHETRLGVSHRNTVRPDEAVKQIINGAIQPRPAWITLRQKRANVIGVVVDRRKNGR